eukprot:2105540-Rhodomonas_salina.1
MSGTGIATGRRTLYGMSGPRYAMSDIDIPHWVPGRRGAQGHGGEGGREKGKEAEEGSGTEGGRGRRE